MRLSLLQFDRLAAAVGFVGRIIAESVGRQPEFVECRQRVGPEQQSVCVGE
jgi:hypothetical protein